MKIAVEGCAHGELEKIYDTIEGIEKDQNIKIDLLLCCGDFQSTRNLEDLQTMAVPKKYQDMCTFYKYYSGERVAPILTIFIGGNHEASNYLQELPYGGWVAPNIYYIGYAGVVHVNGIRIAGLSGIYKGHDFLRGHHEFAPYTEATRKSVYHVRQLEVFRLKQLSGKVDIFMSHDWPRGIYNYGNRAQLLRFKPHFREDVENDHLGSKPCEDLLKILKPSLWFSAHLHCKFAAVVPHDDVDEEDIHADDIDGRDERRNLDNTTETIDRVTKFLALDKCLPKRRFLQVLDFDEIDQTTVQGDQLHFEYDLEWLTILMLTNHLVNVKTSNYYLPGRQGDGGINKERYQFTPSAEELQEVRQKFGDDLRIPKNFCRTVQPYDPNDNGNKTDAQPKAQINPQTVQYCDKLNIDDPLQLAMLISGHDLNHSTNLNLNESHNSITTINDSTAKLNSDIDDDDDINRDENNEEAILLLNKQQQQSPLKRKSGLLSLPKPNQTISDALGISVEQQTIMEDITEPIEKGDACVGTTTLNTSAIETVEIIMGDTLSVKPPIKKFKRRNQGIYQDDTEES